MRKWIAQTVLPDEANLMFHLLRPVKRGPHGDAVMVDVGACHGNALERFAADGWHVVAFEPDQGNRRILEHRVGPLPNVTVDPRAVSDRTDASVPFYRSQVSAGISSLSKFHPSHEAAGEIEMTTLAAASADHGLTRIDFLKVDTEGHDLHVLRALPWDRLRPRVIMCEYEDQKTVALDYSVDDLVEILVRHGYEVMLSEWYPLEEYGGPHRWRQFAASVGDLRDHAGWGNILATSVPDDARRLRRLVRGYAVRWRVGNAINGVRRAVRRKRAS